MFRVYAPTALAALALIPFSARGAGADPGEVTAEAESFQAAFAVETVAEGLDEPWGLAFLPDGRFLVTEKPGGLRIVAPDGAVSASIAPDWSVTETGQGGLLGVALDPAFSENGTFYVCYTTGPQDANFEKVDRARLDGDAAAETETIWTSDSVSRTGHHYGCRLVFANDGTLFVTLGERGAHRYEAQDPSNHFGTVVRIHPDGSIPADNPFANSDVGRDDVWSYGHRNQQGAALHPETGDLWTHEHGPRGGDEINIVRAGVNYGWPTITYGINYDGTPVSDAQQADGMAQPIWYWQPSIAPSGMTFYTGDAFPRWNGDLFVGALAGAQLQRFELDGDHVIGMEPLLVDFGEGIRDVQTGPDGFLYLLTDGEDARLLRLRPR